MTLRDLRHWMNESSRPNYCGPTEAAILMSDGTKITGIDLSNWRQSYNQLNEIDTNNVVATLTKTEKYGWCATAGVVGIHGLQRLYLHGHSGDLDNCCNAIASKVSEFNEECGRLSNDPEELLETLLSTHDWYSHMSDCHAVWAAGETAEKRIRDLMYGGVIDPDKARALYDKYAPKTAEETGK